MTWCSHFEVKFCLDASFFYQIFCESTPFKEKFSLDRGSLKKSFLWIHPFWVYMGNPKAVLPNYPTTTRTRTTLSSPWSVGCGADKKSKESVFAYFPLILLISFPFWLKYDWFSCRISIGIWNILWTFFYFIDKSVLAFLLKQLSYFRSQKCILGSEKNLCPRLPYIRHDSFSSTLPFPHQNTCCWYFSLSLSVIPRSFFSPSRSYAKMK